MPNFFRTLDGKNLGAGQSISLRLADGRETEGHWAGSAKAETLAEKWLRFPGNQLAQTAKVAAVASKAHDTGETIWGDAPPGACLLFVLLAAEPGKDYRLARLVTTAATTGELAWFRHDRSALFGALGRDGSIEKIPPLVPPPPPPKAQGELF